MNCIKLFASCFCLVNINPLEAKFYVFVFITISLITPPIIYKQKWVCKCGPSLSKKGPKAFWSTETSEKYRYSLSRKSKQEESPFLPYIKLNSKKLNEISRKQTILLTHITAKPSPWTRTLEPYMLLQTRNIFVLLNPWVHTGRFPQFSAASCLSLQFCCITAFFLSVKLLGK